MCLGVHGQGQAEVQVRCTCSSMVRELACQDQRLPAARPAARYTLAMPEPLPLGA